MQVYCLFSGHIVERNLFAFRLLDGDNDGEIQAKDFIDIIEKMCGLCQIRGGYNKCFCVLSQEIGCLYNNYFEKNLKVFKRMQTRFTLDYFVRLVGLSCLTTEFKDKLSGEV